MVLSRAFRHPHLACRLPAHVTTHGPADRPSPGFGPAHPLQPPRRSCEAGCGERGGGAARDPWPATVEAKRAVGSLPRASHRRLRRASRGTARGYRAVPLQRAEFKLHLLNASRGRRYGQTNCNSGTATAALQPQRCNSGTATAALQERQGAWPWRKRGRPNAAGPAACRRQRPTPAARALTVSMM